MTFFLTLFYIRTVTIKGDGDGDDTHNEVVRFKSLFHQTLEE